MQALIARKEQLQADIRREAELIDQYKVSIPCLSILMHMVGVAFADCIKGERARED